MADVYKVWDEECTVYLAMKALRDDLANGVVFNQRFMHEVNKLVKFQFLSIALCDDMERKVLIQISLCHAIKLGIY